MQSISSRISPVKPRPVLSTLAGGAGSSSGVVAAAAGAGAGARQRAEEELRRLAGEGGLGAALLNILAEKLIEHGGARTVYIKHEPPPSAAQRTGGRSGWDENHLATVCDALSLHLPDADIVTLFDTLDSTGRGVLTLGDLERAVMVASTAPRQSVTSISQSTTALLRSRQDYFLVHGGVEAPPGSRSARSIPSRRGSLVQLEDELEELRQQLAAWVDARWNNPTAAFAALHNRQDLNGLPYILPDDILSEIAGRRGSAAGLTPLTKAIPGATHTLTSHSPPTIFPHGMLAALFRTYRDRGVPSPRVAYAGPATAVDLDEIAALSLPEWEALLMGKARVASPTLSLSLNMPSEIYLPPPSAQPALRVSRENEEDYAAVTPSAAPSPPAAAAAANGTLRGTGNGNGRGPLASAWSACTKSVVDDATQTQLSGPVAPVTAQQPVQVQQGSSSRRHSTSSSSITDRPPWRPTYHT